MSEHKTSWMAANSSGNGRFVEHEKIELGRNLVNLQWFFLEYKGLCIEIFLFWSWMQCASIHNFIILSQLTPWLCCLKELITNYIDQSLKSMILFNTIIFSRDWTNQLTKTRAIKNQIIGKSEVMNYLKLVLLLKLRVQDHCYQVWTFFFLFTMLNHHFFNSHFVYILFCIDGLFSIWWSGRR